MPAAGALTVAAARAVTEPGASTISSTVPRAACADGDAGVVLAAGGRGQRDRHDQGEREDARPEPGARAGTSRDTQATLCRRGSDIGGDRIRAEASAGGA